jgi:hypothetical protein
VLEDLAQDLDPQEASLVHRAALAHLVDLDEEDLQVRLASRPADHLLVSEAPLLSADLRASLQADEVAHLGSVDKSDKGNLRTSDRKSVEAWSAFLGCGLADRAPTKRSAKYKGSPVHPRLTYLRKPTVGYSGVLLAAQWRKLRGCFEMFGEEIC